MIVRKPHDKKRDRTERNPHELFGIKRKRDSLVMRHAIDRQDDDPQDGKDQPDKTKIEIVEATAINHPVDHLVPCLQHPLSVLLHHLSHPMERGDLISHTPRSAPWRGALMPSLRGPNVHPAPQRQWRALQPERTRQTRHDRGTSSEYPSLDLCARLPPEPYRSSRRLSPTLTSPVWPSPL